MFRCLRTIKLFIGLSLLSAFFISCNQEQPPNARAAAISVTDRWHFRQYLDDPKTPEAAKQAFRDEHQLEDSELPRFISQMRSADTNAHAFYFRGITNTFNKKGVEVPPSTCTEAYRYVMENPGEFANYFTGEDSFSDADLTAWSDIVLLELERMTADQYGRPVIESFLDSLEHNCLNETPQQQKVLKRFGRHLTEGWQRYLMNVEQ